MLTQQHIVRSEGGADCQKLLNDAGREGSAGGRAYKPPPLMHDMGAPKLEHDALDQFGDLSGMGVML